MDNKQVNQVAKHTKINLPQVDPRKTSWRGKKFKYEGWNFLKVLSVFKWFFCLPRVKIRINTERIGKILVGSIPLVNWLT